MSSGPGPVFGVRHPLQAADVLRGPDDDLEHRLVAGAQARRDVVAAGLGARPAGPAEVAVPHLPSRAEVLLQIQTAARTGAPLLSVAPPVGSDPASTPDRAVTGGAQLRQDLEDGWLVRATSAGVWAPALGPVIDAVIAGWQVKVDATIVLAGADRDDEAVAVDRLVIDPATGTTLHVPAGAPGPPLRVDDDLGVRIELELGGLTAADLFAQLTRTAGLDPLLRADLPIGPPRSYGGSLADHPDALWDRVQPFVADGLLESAQAWWVASLAYAPSTVAAGTAPTVPAIAGGPTFLDHRLPQPTDGRRVLALAGHLLMLAPGDVDALLRWLEGGAPPEHGTAVRDAFLQLDLCRPAP